MDREVLLNAMGFTKRSDGSYFKLKDGTMLSFKNERQAMLHAKIILYGYLIAGGISLVLFIKLMDIL